MLKTGTTTASETDLARAAKGVSLGQDAWRRLRRNRTAMLSLVTLVTILLLAFFTPLLPLAPPDKHYTDLQYQPPTLSPFFSQTFKLDWQAIESTPQRMAETRSKLATAEGDATQRIRNDLENILLRPYREAGFPDVGAISRLMIRARYHLFGEWTIGSICGLDEFGR